MLISRKLMIIIKKIFFKLQKAGEKFKGYSYFKIQAAENLWNGNKQTHIVICGASRSGTTLFYNMLRSTLMLKKKPYMPPHENSASKTEWIRNRTIITKRPLDILKIDDITNKFIKIRELFFVCMYRDPRDLVSSQHKNVPNQYFQSWDYQFFFDGQPGGRKSYSNPGLNVIFKNLKNAKNMDNTHYLSYEEIISDPERIQRELQKKYNLTFAGSFADFYKKDIPQSLRPALNEIRPVENKEKAAWLNSDRLERVYQQIVLFPEIEKVAVEWGYPSFEQLIDINDLNLPSLNKQEGTIIAFYTNDSFYTQEAERFRRYLDKLDLKYEIKVVSAKTDWVLNCAMKPEIIAEAREKSNGPILYIDVDAVVRNDPWPYLSQYDGDMAAYVHRDGSLWSGTILVNDTIGARKLLDSWVKLQKEKETTYDQSVLQELISINESKKQAPEFNFQRLPPNMTYIFDKKYEYFYGKIYIEHLQASREPKSKGIINKGLARRNHRINILEHELGLKSIKSDG